MGAFQDTLVGATAGALNGRVSTSGHHYSDVTSSAGAVPLAIDSNGTILVTSATNDAATSIITDWTPPSLTVGYEVSAIIKVFGSGTFQAGPALQFTQGTVSTVWSAYVASFNVSGNQFVLWKNTNSNPYAVLGSSAHTFSPPETHNLYCKVVSDGAGGVNLTVILVGENGNASIITANDPAGSSPLLTGGIGLRMFAPSSTATTGIHVLSWQVGPLVSTLTGPSSGGIDVTSGTFTEALEVPSILGTTASLSVSGVTGAFSPTSLSIAGATPTAAGSTSATFTFTPSTSGTAQITATTASPVTTNADVPFAYTVSGSTASAYTITGPTGGPANTASTDYTITLNGPPPSGGVTVTITPSGGGLSTPITRTFTGSTTTATFTLDPTQAGTVQLIATNSGTLTNPYFLYYYVSATPTTWVYRSSVNNFVSGLSTVGYAVVAHDNSFYTGSSWITAGVAEITGPDGKKTGIYAADIVLPFSGNYHILWTNGQNPPTYATDDRVPDGVDPTGLNIQQAIGLLLAMETGKSQGNQAAGVSSPQFLAPDGSTVRMQGQCDNVGNRDSSSLFPVT